MIIKQKFERTTELVMRLDRGSKKGMTPGQIVDDALKWDDTLQDTNEILTEVTVVLDHTDRVELGINKSM